MFILLNFTTPVHVPHSSVLAAEAQGPEEPGGAAVCGVTTESDTTGRLPAAAAMRVPWVALDYGFGLHFSNHQ